MTVTWTEKYWFLADFTLEQLMHLVDQLLTMPTLAEFAKALHRYPPTTEVQP